MTGQWEVYVPQASIRYEFEKGTKWRVEAGKFTSPIGLGMTENRASVNDSVILWQGGEIRVRCCRAVCGGKEMSYGDQVLGDWICGVVRQSDLDRYSALKY